MEYKISGQENEKGGPLIKDEEIQQKERGSKIIVSIIKK